VTLYGSNGPDRGFDLTLRDVQERDEYRAPKYRGYRGRELPVFSEVKGMTRLSKVRGEDAWHAYIFVPLQSARDMLAILQGERQTFIAINGVKVGRDRWIRRIGLQTTDSAEE